MEITATQPTPKRRPRILLWTVVSLLVAIASALGWRHFHPPGDPKDKLDESCHNCRSFIDMYFHDYAETNGGWFPRGGVTPLDSLAKLIQHRHEVHFFTSHTLSPKLIKHWEQHHTFAPEFTSYRYNEGLNAHDPRGLVLVYFHQPTLWECRSIVHKRTNFGRPVLLTTEGKFEFLYEDDFQKRQADTLRYLVKNDRLKKSTAAQ